MAVASFRYDNVLFHVAPSFWAKDAKRGWAFQFGAYGDFRVVVLAEPGINSLDDALESAAEVVAEEAPGIFATEAVHEAYEEAIAVGKSEEEAYEEAEMDTTSVLSGNEYINSWEWNVEDLDRGSPIFRGAIRVVGRRADRREPRRAREEATNAWPYKASKRQLADYFARKGYRAFARAIEVEDPGALTLYRKLTEPQLVALDKAMHEGTGRRNPRSRRR